MSEAQQVEVNGAKVTPPDTKLTEALVVFQDLFNRNIRFQGMDELTVLSRILDEQGNQKEIARFIDSYLWPPDMDRAYKGMAVMAILGYIIGRGEEKAKVQILS